MCRTRHQGFAQHMRLCPLLHITTCLYQLRDLHWCSHAERLGNRRVLLGCPLCGHLISVLEQPLPQARNGRQGGKTAQFGELREQIIHHTLDQRVAKAHTAQSVLGVADGVENCSACFAQVSACAMLIEQRSNRRRHLLNQRHLHKNQWFIGHFGVKETIAATITVYAVFQICPTADVMHRFILNQLFQQ